MRHPRRVLEQCVLLCYQHCKYESTYRQTSSTSEVVTSRTPTAQVLKLARERNIPVEKYSLSRGLALNRFEKDFLIFPEYPDVESLTRIKSFVSSFQNDFHSSMADVKKENFYEKFNGLAERHQLPSTFIAKDFGGLGMCRKDLLSLYEVYGLNWSFYESINQYYIASLLLSLFGNETQKTRWLPRLASGDLRPAICLSEENVGLDFSAMKTSILSGGDGTLKLSGVKSQVIGPTNANLFFVFGNCVDQKQKANHLACYVFERDDAPKEAVSILTKTKTLGLDDLEVSEVEFRDLTVYDENRLGSLSDGRDAAYEVIAVKNITYAAAVTGFMRSLIENLAHFCNTTVQHNTTLSDSRGVQRIMTDLALNTYVLESMAYYVGGMLDENLVVAVDIENAVVQKFANEILREAVAAVTELLGVSSCDCKYDYEKMFRDVVTVLSLGNTKMNLADHIGMGTLTTWANENAVNLSKIRSGAATFFQTVLGKGNEWRFKENPKLQHFIAEHAHPSLQEACRDLEYTMSRLNGVIGAIISRSGKGIVHDFASICSVAEVVQSNLGMAATIARASRSYAIGLRHSDLELAWTTTYCAYTAQKAFTELKVLDRYFGLVQMSNSLLDVGRAVCDFKGYCVESPTELNW